MLSRPIRRLMSQIPMLILIDFDQTITMHDTIGTLGQFGVSQTHNSKPWSFFVDSYLKEYRQHRDGLSKPTNFKDFLEQLESYQPIEQASLTRITHHKVFQGLSRQDILKEAQSQRSIQLLPNVLSTLKAYQENIRIVSLNWSKDWIVGFTGLKRDQIYSNDLNFVNDICTGEIVPHILTTGDKQRVIQSSIVTGEKIIYIGDSLGDIQPLVESDVGIIIGKDKSLLQSLNQFGYNVKEDITQQSHLYRVDHWDQIKIILDTQNKKKV